MEKAKEIPENYIPEEKEWFFYISWYEASYNRLPNTSNSFIRSFLYENENQMDEAIAKEKIMARQEKSNGSTLKIKKFSILLPL